MTPANKVSFVTNPVNDSLNLNEKTVSIATSHVFAATLEREFGGRESNI